MLAAPLLLPGLQLIAQSGRTGTGNYDNLTTPDHGGLQLFFQGFDGLPVVGSHWFGSLTYQWDAAYVGVIAIVLGVVALGTRWKRPEVRGIDRSHRTDVDLGARSGCPVSRQRPALCRRVILPGP